MSTPLSAQQIYDIFHEGPGTAMWEAAEKAASQLAQSMPALAADIARLQDTMRGAWQGNAADVAIQGAEPLALEYMHTADNLRVAQDLVGRQTASFQTAKQSVRPLPPQPLAVDAIAAVLGSPTAQQQFADHLAAAQHNVDVYNAYHGASGYNTTQLPTAFGHLGTDGAAVAVNPATTSTSSANPLAIREGAGASEPGRPAAAGMSHRDGVQPSITPRSAIGPTVRQPITDVTTPAAAGQGQTGSAWSPLPPLGTSGAVAAASSQPNPLSSMHTGMTGIGNVLPPAAFEFGPVGGADGLPGQASNATGDGSSPGTDGAPGRSIAEPPVDVVGVRPAGQAAQRLPNTSTGEPDEGLPFLPMTAGASKREDEEHRVPTYLQPADPNGLFGTTENAVRPVIGE